MAVAYASHNTDTSLGTSPVVTKPTGLAVGDLMIAGIMVVDGGTASTPSNWALQETDNVGQLALYIFTKFADSSDVAASNFTFTTDQAAFGSLFRITGATEIDVSTSVTFGNNSSTTKTAAGVTPTLGNLLYMIFAGGTDGVAAPSFSNYAMATSNPSWSEAFDFNSGIAGFGAAYATRSASTATGNYSVDLTNQTVNTDSITILLVVSDRVDVVNSPTNIPITVSVPTPMAAAQISVTVNDPVDTATAQDWTNTTKSSTTWSNVSKS